MGSGLKIEVNEKDFLKKTVKEQNLDLYKAVCYMNDHGCKWARNNKRFLSVKQILASFFGGASVVIAKMAVWK